MSDAVNIKDHSIHLWRFLLSDFNYSFFESQLSPEEEMRAKRFHFEKDRKRFVIARGLLRTVLGLYIQQLPQNIQFNYGARGKPYLENNSLDIQFNISHSHDVAIIGLTKHYEIGIDIEKIQDKQHLDLAKRFFTEEEYKQLVSLPCEQQSAAFYQLWTCKEAVIKAVGEGLYLSLKDFIVSPKKQVQWLTLHSKEKPETKFYLEQFHAFPQYKSAFATNQKIDSIVLWDWQNNKPLSVNAFL